MRPGSWEWRESRCDDARFRVDQLRPKACRLASFTNHGAAVAYASWFTEAGEMVVVVDTGERPSAPGGGS